MGKHRSQGCKRVCYVGRGGVLRRIARRLIDRQKHIVRLPGDGVGEPHCVLPCVFVAVRRRPIVEGERGRPTGLGYDVVRRGHLGVDLLRTGPRPLPIGLVTDLPRIHPFPQVTQRRPGAVGHLGGRQLRKLFGVHHLHHDLRPVVDSGHRIPVLLGLHRSVHDHPHRERGGACRHEVQAPAQVI